MKYKIVLFALFLLFSCGTDNGPDNPVDPNPDPGPIDPPPVIEGLPAFPGAEGFGSTTPGGRGGRIIEVTNLDPIGPGSLLDAVKASGPRIIVFRVAGTIEPATAVTISNPFVTIAGQTAPGGGICIKGKEFIIETHDVIVRGLRFRLGDQNGNKDSFRISGSRGGASNIIIDHCTVSWGMDENASVITNSQNITFSWNLFSEALNAIGQSFGLLLAKDGPKNISVHHNLFVHNRARSAKVARDVSAEVINNIVYNYGTKATTANPGAKINIIGNRFIPGANTLGAPSNPAKGVDIELRGPDGSSGTSPALYVVGNIGPGRESNSGDEWNVVDGDRQFESSEPAVTPSGITSQNVEDIFDLVLNNAGVTVPKRDAVDTRVVADVRNRSGQIIVSQNEVGGWPQLEAGTPPQDSDHDGMPDDWERANGLDPSNAADAGGDRNQDGYSNIEEYINSLITIQ